ncbi:MAG: winged helix-turn-helix transcriptional regulator, partial [Treponema sp.]|nr:winged helix-turn-helix transcriptional regulator [Treponema sp.]
DLIKSNPQISRKQLCDELGINPSAVQKHIEKLKEQDAIRRVGGAKGGHWEIIKK